MSDASNTVGVEPGRTTQARLAEAVGRMPPPVFAVVDGGQFDDVSIWLARSGLHVLSLFNGHGAQGAGRFGPWFVSIRRSGDAALLLAIIGDLPVVVFWCCPAGGRLEMYHHLRRLNMARIPAWSVAGKDGPDFDDPADLRSKAVLFRHWDPRVLGALLPVLDEGQFSRVVGPAQEIAFVAEDYGGLKRVIADPQWSVAPHGMLTITSDQMLSLIGRRRAASQWRVAGYLREVFPEIDRHLPASGMATLVREAELSGRSLGIRTEAGHKRWAYLVVASDGQVTRTPGALQFVRAEGRSADDQVRLMMDRLASRLRQSTNGQVNPQ